MTYIRPSLEVNIPAYAEFFSKKLKKIKVALFDVDGVLTDGSIFYSGSELGFNRFFNVQDGYGLKLLRSFGLKVGIITGGSSLGVMKRFNENLKLDFFYHGDEDKREALEEIHSQGFSYEEMSYIGDEFFDLPLLQKVGFSATVPSASPEIQALVDYVTTRKGGMGAGREIIDLIRFAQGLHPLKTIIKGRKSATE